MCMLKDKFRNVSKNKWVEWPLYTPLIYKIKCQPMHTYKTSLFHPNQAYETSDCFIEMLSMTQDNVSS